MGDRHPVTNFSCQTIRITGWTKWRDQCIFDFYQMLSIPQLFLVFLQNTGSAQSFTLSSQPCLIEKCLIIVLRNISRKMQVNELRYTIFFPGAEVIFGVEVHRLVPKLLMCRSCSFRISIAPERWYQGHTGNNSKKRFWLVNFNQMSKSLSLS